MPLINSSRAYCTLVLRAKKTKCQRFDWRHHADLKIKGEEFRLWHLADSGSHAEHVSSWG